MPLLGLEGSPGSVSNAKKVAKHWVEHCASSKMLVESEFGISTGHKAYQKKMNFSSLSDMCIFLAVFTVPFWCCKEINSNCWVFLANKVSSSQYFLYSSQIVSLDKFEDLWQYIIIVSIKIWMKITKLEIIRGVDLVKKEVLHFNLWPKPQSVINKVNWTLNIASFFYFVMHRCLVPFHTWLWARC